MELVTASMFVARLQCSHPPREVGSESNNSNSRGKQYRALAGRQAASSDPDRFARRVQKTFQHSASSCILPAYAPSSLHLNLHHPLLRIPRHLFLSSLLLCRNIIDPLLFLSLPLPLLNMSLPRHPKNLLLQPGF